MPQRLRAFVVFAFVCAALAATGIVARAAGQAGTSNETSRFGVLGCLRQGVPSQANSKNAQLVITDYRGGPVPTTFRLDPSDNSKLLPWVDSTLEITVTLAGGSPITTAKGAPRVLDVKLEKLAVISRRCLEQKSGEK